MTQKQSLKLIDYLLIGHLTKDLLADGGSKMGGTLSYSGLTALALGNKVHALTSCSTAQDLSPLEGMELEICPADETTTFRNISTEAGRTQYLYGKAKTLGLGEVKGHLQSASIVHLGPVAGEIDPAIYQAFDEETFLGLTPQGWLRGFHADGRVYPTAWPHDESLLRRADATVLSFEDLGQNPEALEYWKAESRLLVLTRNKQGATVFHKGKELAFKAPDVPLVEDTGAGDIFAASFFHAFFQTKDLERASRFAVDLAASSVTRSGFASIPTEEEIKTASQKYGIRAGKNG